MFFKKILPLLIITVVFFSTLSIIGSHGIGITKRVLADPGTVEFPDSNLEAAIRDIIAKPGGDIDTADLEALTSLDASSRNITDITGLEYCTGLTELDLNSNQIEDIGPLVDNTGISSGDILNLQDNPLSATSIRNYVPQLEGRGVTVLYTIPPNADTVTGYIIVNTIMAEQAISPDSPATVESKDSQVVIEFPEGSVVDDAVVTIRRKSQVDIAESPSGFKAGATCFSIELTADLVPGTDITITIKYSEADVEACDGDPSKLRLSRYNDDTGEWIILPTTVDTEAMTLTATTDQFSTWMVMVQESPDNQIALWVWFVSAFGGLLVLFAGGSALVMIRRKLAR